MISIVTINYNNLEGLKKTVESVLHQTAVNSIEYIVIDGFSTDGCQDYLQSLPNNVIWVSERDKGISDAFNKGLKKATGECVLFLNSGDVLINNNVIEIVIKDWAQKKVDILSYRVKVNDTTFIPSKSLSTKEIFDTCCEPHQGTFISSKVFNLIGGFSEEYKIRMDYHFFARCKESDFSFDYIPKDIVLYEEDGVSMKKENRVKFWKEGLSVKILYNIEFSFKDWIKCLLYIR